MAIHHVARLGHRNWRIVDQLHDLQTISDRRQWIAQFVSQHGQEFGLAPVGLGQICGQLAKVVGRTMLPVASGLEFDSPEMFGRGVSKYLCVAPKRPIGASQPDHHAVSEKSAPVLSDVPSLVRGATCRCRTLHFKLRRASFAILGREDEADRLTNGFVRPPARHCCGTTFPLGDFALHVRENESVVSRVFQD